jgi:hypothetical protein
MAYTKAVTVLEVSDSFALSLAESARIDADTSYLIEADDPQYLPGIGSTSGIGAVPLWSCGSRIKVPEIWRSELGNYSYRCSCSTGTVTQSDRRSSLPMPVDGRPPARA